MEDQNKSLSIDEKYHLITRNLQEMLGNEEELRQIISERPLKLYWGTATTGRIHIGYFIQFLKIADYLKAGCHIKILFADLHAFLDNMKSSLEQLEWRTKYYQLIIKEVLKSMGIDISRLEFVKGTDYQLSRNYTMDIYKLMSITSLNDAKHSGAEVVKQNENPKLNSLVYPLLQVLDEEYLDVDGEASGIDQRKIFVYGRTFMPKLGYKKRLYFMTPMVPGLSFEKNNNDANANIQDTKMSASNIDSKIDLLDTKNQLKKKINKAYCLPGETDDNSPLTMLEKVIMPILDYRNIKFSINRSDEYGGNLTFNNINEVINLFKANELHPQDLKTGIIDALDLILEPIRNIFLEKENIHLLNMSYDDKYFRKNK